MPTLSDIFDKRKILLYQNENLDLDHYYQEPYQDENDEIKEMGKPFETDESKKIRTIDLDNEDRTYSGFSYFMDGSRRTYKIGDIVLERKKIFPVVAAQIRAGCSAYAVQRHPCNHAVYCQFCGSGGGRRGFCSQHIENDASDRHCNGDFGYGSVVLLGASETEYFHPESKCLF